MFVNCLALGKVNALSLSFNICKMGIVLPVLKDHANNEMMADIMHGSEQVCSDIESWFCSIHILHLQIIAQNHSSVAFISYM